MEMNFKIADSVTFGFSVGSGRTEPENNEVYGYSIVIPDSYNRFFISGDTPIGYVETEE